MCSIIATNKKIRNLDSINFFSKFRGPDLTTHERIKGFDVVHNLLSITGEFKKQPFVDGEIVALHNGEIYNYHDFGTFDSDGESIIPLYKKYGPSFLKKLDGEFAIVLIDFQKRLLIASTDVFATKPLWIAHGSDIGVATYQSSLKRLGFDAPRKIPANTCIIFNLDNYIEIEQFELFPFDLTQHKNDLSDFNRALEESIRKRTNNLREKIFVPLSSGYDSGVLACGLKEQCIPFKVYSILGKENEVVLKDRNRIHSESDLIDFDYNCYLKAKNHLKKFAEPFLFRLREKYPPMLLSEDSGAIGLSYICSRAREEGRKILFSGQGVDEIYSDYGFLGKSINGLSVFGGKFPSDLSTEFPWRNFYGGSQEAYLAKEELVAGSYGIEARYPFLDKFLVQEFLWLTADVKNQAYKYPFKSYLLDHKYPFEEDVKVGFVTREYSLKDKLLPKALILRFYWRVLDWIRKL